MIYSLLILALAGLLTGCGSFLPDKKTLPGPSAVEIYQARREPPPPLEPALSVMPRAPINDPQPATIAQTPLPVWNDAQVVKVDLDAYVNEKGEAFGPSTKYVVKQPGGWNVDALRNPHRSYVPSENTPPIPSRDGFAANPLVSPGDGAKTIGEPRPLQPSVLQDISHVRVTGFVERGQERMARSLAQPGEVPLFDESLGWVLVPSSSLTPVNMVPNPMVSPATIPVAQPLQQARPMMNQPTSYQQPQMQQMQPMQQVQPMQMQNMQMNGQVPAMNQQSYTPVAPQMR